MHFEIKPSAVLSALLLCIVLLLILNVVGIFYGFEASRSERRIAQLVHFNSEESLPTLFSTLILLVSAFLLIVISRFHKTERTGHLLWAGLAMIFLFLAVDESITIHELISGKLREHFDFSGIFYFAWIIPYGLALILIMLVYFRLVINLPRKIMWLFIASGLIYVAGAIGFEMIGGQEFELDSRAAKNWRNMNYLVITTMEELLEKLGISLFIYSLLEYISVTFGPLSISIRYKRENK